MTDSEILEALDCCKYDDCNNCPNVVDNCHANLIDYAISLINRQKEEIKRLQKEVNLISMQFQDIQERQEESQAEIDKLNKVYQANQQLINALNKSYFLAKSEAIKEFAERVKDLIYEADDINPVSETQIDNLVKEMVGE